MNRKNPGVYWTLVQAQAKKGRFHAENQLVFTFVDFALRPNL
jgi:hypothetical protein